MNRLSRLIATAMATAAPLAASADEDTSYVGGNIHSLELSAISGNRAADLSSAYGRFGVLIDRYTSFELRIGTGLAGDQFSNSTAGADIELDATYGAYLRGGYPLFGRVHPYLLLGYTWTEFALSDSASVVREENEDISFGVGVDVLLTKHLGLNIEYTQAIKEDGIKLKGPAIGFIAYFDANHSPRYGD